MFEREHKCSKTKAKKDSFDFPISDIFWDSPSTVGLKLCYTNCLKLATYHVSNMFGHGFSCQILHNTIGFSLLTVKPLKDENRGGGGRSGPPPNRYEAGDT
eukprot:TRINITY_DN8140_c1_g1_i3.p1 TRINITY_DN8140_c1_g1~~TRINITY_DN8140_c1_g1_i3.p1  ORF type:complete len:101 (+),score=5.92 TRINITY_DN8140_c1_g1_i3:922-1224(+)